VGWGPSSGKAGWLEEEGVTSWSIKHRSFLEELALAPDHEHLVGFKGSKKDRLKDPKRQEIEVSNYVSWSQGTKSRDKTGRNYEVALDFLFSFG
jgi:hypothetical protein